VVYTCFLLIFAILFINDKFNGTLTNDIDLVFCIVAWPEVIIITGILILMGYRSQKEDRLISYLGSIGLLILSVYGTWWILNQRTLDQKFEAIKMEAWTIARASGGK
jgi:hypothetical protein